MALSVSPSLYDQTSSTFFLRSTNGQLDPVKFGSTSFTYDALAGDWDGDGNLGTGLFQTNNAKFYLRDDSGSVNSFRFGSVATADAGKYQALAGDWDGDDNVGVALYDETSSTFFTRTDDGVVTSIRMGSAAKAQAGDYQGIAGDWDGDGDSDVGLYDQVSGTFYLRAENGALDSFRLGSVAKAQAGDYQVVTGDWDGDGESDVGLYDNVSGTYFLRNGDGTIEQLRFGSVATAQAGGYQALGVPTPVEQTPGETFTLTTDVDLINGTANNDTIEGTDTTYTTGDVILGNGGNNVLNIEAAANPAETATVAGVQSINFNAKSFATLTYDAAGVVGNGTTITFNNTQVGGSTSGTVNNVASSATVAAGSQMTGTFTVDLGASASGVTVNGASASTIAVTDAGKGGVTVVSDKTGTTGTPVNVSVDGAGSTTGGIADDAATVKAMGVVSLETATSNSQVENLTLEGNGAAATFDLDATGDAPEKVTFTGDQDVTLIGTAAQFDTETAIDNTTAGTTTIKIDDGASANLEKLAVDVIEIADGAAAAAATYNVADEATVKLSPAALTAGGNLIFDSTVIGNTDTAETLTLEIDDAVDLDANALDTKDFETLNLSTADADINADDSNVVIANLIASAGANAVVNVTGATDLTLTAVTAKEIAAGGFTGNLAATLSANMNKITTGSGDDTFTAYDGDFTIMANGGSDTLNVVDSLDLSDNTVSMTGIDVININSDGDAAVDTLKLKSSILDGTSYVVKGNETTDPDILEAVMDATTLDLSSLVVDTTSATVTVTNTAVNGIAQSIQGSNGADTLNSVGAGNVTMNGNGGNDSITTAGGADVINGGAGNDNIVSGAGNDTVTGGEGADNITGGGGADTIILTETTSAEDNVIYAALTDGSAAGQVGGTFTGFDVITGFNTTVDDLIFDSNYQNDGAVDTSFISASTVVAGTAATSAANDLTAADITNVDKVAAFLSDGTYTTSGAGNDDLVAITFDDFTALYTVTDAAGGGDIVAGEISLLGTVDETLVTGDLVIA
ncbi:hypothetical protein CKO42_09030 [Lamprobacter modestohalophilus]|uniref:Calcium-binding protein n=1 Tax=Lamprobacter modestohalophilus TaxID=1064514 RepID=A0A9X0W7T8_9GAMM|nr:calcium-binding protein [Lamprobacter modestohalophilus]MBK1618578.1 hypothetical protein [Lamprobacter modestohalophilus]